MLPIPTVHVRPRRASVSPLLLLVGLAGHLVTPIPSSAAVPPLTIPWGNVSLQDLQATTCATDSNAEAIILADVGRFEMTHDDYTSFTHTRRIKLLKESAYARWGTIRIFYNSAQGRQSVEQISAHTLSLNPDGTTKAVELPARDIFDEKVTSTLRQRKFTFPSLTPGCVIEYKYEIHGSSLWIPGWQFQMSEPVRQSAFSVSVPSNCRLLFWKRGDHAGVQETRIEHAWPASMWDMDRAARYGLKLFEYRWTARDMPALRAEPFLTTLDDYLASLKVIPDGFDWGGALPVDHTDSWEKEARWLSDFEAFGGAVHLGAQGKEKVNVLIAGLTDTTARIQVIYDYVRTAIRCDGDAGIYGNSAERTLEDHAGSEAEVNFLLIAMLRKAGLRAWPVLLSTRDNGEPYLNYPLLEQFNYVATAVDRDGRYDLLDPTDPFRPAGLLAPRALSEYAWVVRRDEPEWISIPTDQSTSRMIEVSARLDPQGTVSGRVFGQQTGYSAVDARTAWKAVRGDSTKCRQHLTKAFFPEFAGTTVEKFEVSGDDAPGEPLGVLLQFAGTDAAVAAGPELVLKPFFLSGMARNSFRQAERHYPVSLDHAIREHYRLELQLPAGWKCPALPADLSVGLPNGAGWLTRHYEVNGSVLIYERNVIVKQVEFAVSDYQALRGFFDRVAETAGEEVFLTEDSGPQAAERRVGQ